MTIAAKHMDPLVGLDTHIILIPTPAGPVPTPLPHPYVGMVLDPFDYAPFIGATTFINGLPRGQAGTAGVALPPHIPMGGPFAKPPTNESEIFMGSAIVCTEDEPQSFLGCMVLSCQDIGMPPPPRIKRHSTPKTLLLPTTTVLSIPMGMVVMIGGPPTISLMGMAFSAVLGGLSLLKKLGPVARAIKKASDKIHDLAAKLMKKRGLGDGARNLVHKAICAVTGHPVDVATGKVFTDRVDFELPGPIPFEWERTWYSTSTYQGPLGHGWHHSYDERLYIDDEVILYQTGDGRHIGLPHLRPEEKHFDRAEKLTFYQDGLGYVIRTGEGRLHRFVRVHGRPSNDIPLVEIWDTVGNRLVLRYDAWGRLAHIVDCAGRQIGIAYDQTGRIASLAAPHPHQPDQQIYVARYAYDTLGNLATVWDALGVPQVFAYQGHLLVRETDRRGFAFYFAYDGPDHTARCIRTWGDGGLYDHKLTYDLDAQITVVENSLGLKTTHFLDDGLPWKTIDPAGNITVIERNAFREVEKETNPVGAVTQTEYDDRGNAVKVTAADGAVTEYEYDDNDQVLRAVDALGNESLWEYDANGKLTARTDPFGRRTEYQWNGHQLVAIVDPANNRIAFDYDAQGEAKAFMFRDGGVQRWTRDGWGRIEEAHDVNGNVERREHDLLNRIVRAREADGNFNEFEYDAEANVTATRDQQRLVEFTYSGFGKLATRSEGGTSISFRYNTEEQLVAIANELGSTYHFEYGPTGALTLERGFDGVTKAYTRDPADRISRVVRSGGIVEAYEYDACDRLVKVKYSDGSKEIYKYRPDGELIEAANDTTRVKFELDAMGNVLRETQGTEWVASDYNLVGHRVRVRSSKGIDIGYSLNLVGDCTALTASRSSATDLDPNATGTSLLQMTFGRDKLGLEIERLMPGGARVKWQRDSLGRPLKQEVFSSSGFFSAREYRWDVNERLTMVIDALRGPFRYMHDVFGNLAATFLPQGQVDRRMPDALSRLFRTDARTDRKYDDAGQILESTGPNGTTRYEYDGDGNLTSKLLPDGRAWSYEWNAAGMLARVVRPDGDAVEFGYDALARRVWKRFRGRTTRWVWDGNTPLHEWVEGDAAGESASGVAVANGEEAASVQRAIGLAPRSAQGPPAAKPIFGTADEPLTWVLDPRSLVPLGKIVDGRGFGIVVDHVGTPTAMFDDSGSLAWATELDAYGAAAPVHGAPEECPFRWRGQYEDPETGLHYNRLRYYDPDSGEYISQDPLRAEAALEMYAYVPDPNVDTDTFGLATDPIHHIATNKNDIATARGGPWTPKFQKIFDQAGVDMDDAMNKVPIPDHKGPHPKEYHETIHKRLKEAIKGKQGKAAKRAALKKELDKLRGELCDRRTRLNGLVTKRICP